MSQIEVVDGGLVLRERILETMTLRGLMDSVFGIEPGGLSLPAGTSPGLMAELLCAGCSRHLESDEHCSCKTGVTIVVDDKLLAMKLKDFVALIMKEGGLTEYEQEVMNLLFRVVIYKLEENTSPLEAQAALVLMEVIR